MLSCRDVATLIATEELLHAGRLTRLRAQMHLLLCRHCRRYARELRAIAEAARDAARAGLSSPARLDEIGRSVLERSGTLRRKLNPPLT